MGGISCWIAGGNSVIASTFSDAVPPVRAALAGCTSDDRIGSFLVGAIAPGDEMRGCVLAGEGARVSGVSTDFDGNGGVVAIGGCAGPNGLEASGSSTGAVCWFCHGCN